MCVLQGEVVMAYHGGLVEWCVCVCVCVCVWVGGWVCVGGGGGMAGVGV